ncbi:eukaryotic translation initiation factor 2-alpha kinase isoform X1 [Drosophila bipectinata]|uniref:eukaryotic translation initiation factor 2-alpha kinase isoform X1 n=1 Tax=Drosophila bipectinata TaxID=42026 RepID=UPI001C892DC7|nr:eukaryotic translation initiation factor 2-alpha kinase isoform X1 [Drosophila bipectinata]
MMGMQDDLDGIVRNRRKNLSLLQLLALTMAGLVAVNPVQIQAQPRDLEAPGSPRPPALTHCVEEDRSRIGRRLLYITTLDGRLSALDIGKSGKLRWSVPTGPGPLISSSIHRLELTNNGQFVRMIPSLSGGIYKFDGDSIDPIPITAEHLLSSSAKFSDDLVISGGKETRTYGVSVRTGQLLYECSINGCVNTTDEGRAINDTIEEPELGDSPGDEDDDHLRDEAGYVVGHDPLLDDVIVVRRQTQTVRAVESRTGMERWNFSVGQHELDLVPAAECNHQPRDELELAVLDVDIKVVVPEGVICAFSKSDPQSMLWKYKFDHPIVSAWNTNAADELKPIDLFSSAQWLWDLDQDEDELPNRPQAAPSIYLGMYDKQLYIQESIRLRQEIMDQTQVYQQLTGDTSLMPKIPWKPIAASSNSLVIFKKDQEVPEVIGEAPKQQGSELVPYDEHNYAVAAQSVLNASEFVNGNGFYFYTTAELENPSECGTNETPSDFPAIEAPPDPSNVTDSEPRGNTSINDDLGFSLDDIDAPVKVVILSLWFWWKEIVVIAFTSAVILNIFMGQRNQRVEREYLVIERHVPVQTAIEATEASTQALLGPVVPLQRPVNRFSFPNPNQRTISESTSHSGEHYTSRFQTDFELMQCLGRGGFGVVFEAKNKLDENRYAIKRITLPNKDSSRQRVLREARTLASCEHHNIVRYFHSWTETPPTGWQEEEDRKLLAHELSTSIQIETPDESTLPSLAEQLKEKRHQQLLSWVSDAANSTACSHDFHGHGEPSLRNIREEYDDDEEEDSLIEFRSESQSAALRAGDNDDEDDDDDDEDEDDEEEHLEEDKKRLQRSSVSIDIHSASFDLKNINYSQHQLVSNSFQIESVRSKSNVSDDTEDDSKPRKKPLTLALAHNHNNNGSHPTPPSATLQNGVVAKPSKVYLYIQMQLCRKESLRDWLRDNRTEARTAHIADIFHQIVDAVDYVHLKGLIHRDLKPSNIFFSQDGQIKIGDFGLVTDMADIPNLVAKCGDQTGLPSCARHTQQVGTHLYMSPEQLLGRHYDYKVDIYSLGLIFFELHVYFCTEMERIKTMRNLRDGQYPKDFAVKYPEQYDLLQQMLSADPEQRPQTKQLKSQLHEILQLPQHLMEGRGEHAVLAERARRLSRSRTFSSSSEQQQ